MVVSVNLAIDAYGIYKIPNFSGINHVKPKRTSNDRLHKKVLILFE
jgi:hypothetical protein